MESAAALILGVSGAALAALFAAAAGQRVGAPLLLVFLAVGLLAGPEGPGGFAIEHPDGAFAFASAALAVILLDGALRTRPDTLRRGLGPGLALATAATAATAALTGLVAMFALGMGWRESLLIGAIVSSTDAAAVFSLIGRAGARVRPRLAATLETESGLNDPIAVFLTVALAASLAGVGETSPAGVAGALVWQLVGGAIIGGAGGAALVWARPRLPLVEGLRPILTLAAGLFTFAAAQSVGASGFLAVYIAGVLQALLARDDVAAETQALDGFAWLAQLSLFLILGLMASPSHLIAVAAPAAAIAIALMFLARPLAVWATLMGFGFPRRERAFAAWAGLRGATPIFLGLAPAALGAPNANLYFSVAFIVACLSLVAQGWTTPLAARALGVTDTDTDAAAPARIKPQNVAAVAVGVAACWIVVVMLARGVGAPQQEAFAPESAEQLGAVLEQERAPTPTTFPPDWTELDEAARRTLFIETVAAVARIENEAVAADRARVAAWADADSAGRPLSLRDQADRDVLARAYGVRYGDMDALLTRVDGAPAALIVAQAALTSGWGSTRAAQTENVLFGLRGSHPDLAGSVRRYLHTLNTHDDFEPFRAARAAARAEGRAPAAAELVAFVGPFAASGDAFAANVAAVLRSVDMAGLDGEGSEETPDPAPAPAASSDPP